MNYDEQYRSFLNDIGDINLTDEGISLEEIPATFGQVQFLQTMFESRMADCLPEHEYRMVETWLNGSLSYAEASKLIDRILECQPNEPPVKEKELAKWIKRNKL